MQAANEDTVEEVVRLLERHDIDGLTELLSALGPGDRSWLFAHLPASDRQAVVEMLSPEAVAELVHEISDPQALEVIGGLPAARAAEVVAELETDERADILSLLPPPSAESILGAMGKADADDARRLLSYPADSAGGLMVTDVLRFRATAPVGEVIDDLRSGAEHYSDYDVQYAYVVDAQDRLIGVLRLRDMLFAGPSQPVADAMIRNPDCVPSTATLVQLREFFDDHSFVGAPVVDGEGRLLGVVRRFAVEEALRNQMGKLYRRLNGIVGGDELRSMPLHQRSARRLSWLTANIFLNMLAASVIAANQDTLAAAIVLAVFLPMISDMSGCSGNQAVAVSLRELTLGLVRPTELMRTLGKEMSVGVINGLALGILLGGAAALWQQNVWLGLVVGGALALNTIVAVSLGGVIPLALRRLRLDPALASGPLLTTVTDMCGFFFVLTLAGRVIERLT